MAKYEAVVDALTERASSPWDRHHTNEFKLSREDVTLLEAQGQAIGRAYAKLAFNVKEGGGKISAMAEDVIDNDARVSVVVDCNAISTR